MTAPAGGTMGPMFSKIIMKRTDDKNTAATVKI